MIISFKVGCIQTLIADGESHPKKKQKKSHQISVNISLPPWKPMENPENSEQSYGILLNSVNVP